MKSHQLGLLLALAVAAVVLATASSMLFGGSAFLRYVYAAIVLVAGLVISQALAKASTVLLRPRFHRNSLAIGYVISIFGSVAAVLGAASFAPFSPTELLASAALIGVVLGLAPQPTLNEQSDKQFYFLKIVLNSQANDHTTKSEILSKLVCIQRQLEEEIRR